MSKPRERPPTHSASIAAVHEAGHVVVGSHYGWTITSAKIASAGDGLVRWAQPLDWAEPALMLDASLAGWLAEVRRPGHPMPAFRYSAVSEDHALGGMQNVADFLTAYRAATMLALPAFVKKHPDGGTIPHRSIAKEIRAGEVRVDAILDASWAALLRVAAALQQSNGRVVKGSKLAKLLEGENP